MKVTISGDKALLKALGNLPKIVAKKALRQAMRPAMKIVQDSAKKNAPVDTGLTRKSIKVRAMKRSTKFIGIDVLIGEGDYKGKTFYASFVEYGTSKMAPKPFMKPAFTGVGDVAKTYAINKLRQLVEANNGN